MRSVLIQRVILGTKGRIYKKIPTAEVMNITNDIVWLRHFLLALRLTAHEHDTHHGQDA
jgi:hypothetical protein